MLAVGIFLLPLPVLLPFKYSLSLLLILTIAVGVVRDRVRTFQPLSRTSINTWSLLNDGAFLGTLLLGAAL